MDKSKLLHLARHFRSNLIPVGCVLGVLVVMYMVGGILFYNWATGLLAAIVFTGILTWIEYEEPRSEASVAIDTRPSFDSIKEARTQAREQLYFPAEVRLSKSEEPPQPNTEDEA